MTTGIFNTGNFTTDLAKPSFATMITRLMPNGSAPLFGLTSMLPEETAVATEHGFFTKTMLFPEMHVDGAIASAATTTIVVDTTVNVLPGMIMRVNSSGENIIINSVLNSTQVSVTRGVGTVAATDIDDDDYLYQVGNAFEESSLRPNAQNIIPVRVTNLTQIFRNTWAISGSAAATQVIAGETTMAENRQDCASFHAADIEKAILFGQKSEGTRNGQPFRTMAGHVASVTDTTYYPPIYAGVANVTTLGATTTFTQLETALDPVFNQATDPKGANERVLFAGGTAVKVLNAIGRLNGTYQLMEGETNYGLQFSTFKLARGTFRVIEHPILNTNTNWAKMGIVVDLSTFRLAYLNNRKTKNEEFNTQGNQAQDNGIDAVGGTLTTELTCVVKNPPANAILYGFTAGAAG